MKSAIILATALFAFATQTFAYSGPKEEKTESENPHALTYDIRLADNIGGTMPLGMPACIRHLNSFSPHFNPQLAAYVTIPLKHDFNIVTGLRADRKSMRIDADAKAYYVEMTRGGEPVVGYFTGKVNLSSNLWSITIPVYASYDLSSRFSLRFGPYISFVVHRNFSGYAYEGYLRSISSLEQIDSEYLYSLIQSGLDLSSMTNADLINMLHSVPHEYQYPTGERLEVGTSADQRGDFDFSSDMRRVLYGLDFGVDWNLTRTFGIYADLQWGLNGIFKSSFTTVSYTMYPLFGTIGIFKKI